MKKSALLAAFLTLLFFSCSLTLDGSPRGSGEGSQTPVEQYIDFSKRYDTSINFNLYEPSERYIILPNFKDSTLLSKLNIKKIKIIYGVTDGETYNETVDATPGTSTISVNISLPGGNYNMSLEAIDANGKVVLKAAQKAVTVRANVVLSFALSPYQDKTSSDAKGSVKATLYFPSGSGSYCVKCGIDNNETASKDVTLSSTGTTECVFEIENVNPGSHPFNVVIANDSTFTNPVVISLSVIVYSNMVSDTSFDASGSSLVSKTIEFTSQLMQAVTLNDYALCINGTGGAFTGSSESVAGKLNTKFSTNFKNAVLFDSLKQALAFINDVYPATEEKTVYISGTVKECNINFNMSGKTVNLTGYKPSSGDIAQIDATGLDGKLFDVSSGTVKVNDLTLTGGDAGSGNGGAVNVAGGTFELADGAVIKGNSCTGKGDGVYVDSGNFIISGSAYVDSDDCVYLESGKEIYVKGELNLPTEAGGFAATITPSSYDSNVTVLIGDTAGAAYNASDKIKVTAQTDSLREWEIEKNTGNLTPKTPMITIAETGVAGSEKYYYTLNNCYNAIAGNDSEYTGKNIDIELYSGASSEKSENAMKNSSTSNTIPNAIRNTSSNSVRLMVASGNTIEIQEDVTQLFYECGKLIYADLKGFNTENVKNMYRWFYRCNNLTYLNLKSFNTEKVTSLFQMFQTCQKLKVLDLTSFDTTKVTNMNSTFNLCSMLETIYVSGNFKTDSVTDSTAMFQTCTSLVGGKGTTLSNVNNNTTHTYARIDGGPSTATKGLFTAGPPIGPKLRPDAVGDIVFKDGSAMASSDIASITDAQKEAAIAVIFYKGTRLNNGDDSTTERLLGVGLCQGTKSWCIGGANASSVRIETILCENEPGNYGVWPNPAVRDGRQNFEKIGQYLESNDDTGTPGKYPAFEFARNYKEQENSRVEETPYEKGWYLPTFAELYYVRGKKGDLNSVFNSLGVSELNVGNNIFYWSSSQSHATGTDYDGKAIFLNMVSGISHGSKSMEKSVLVIRQF